MTTVVTYKLSDAHTLDYILQLPVNLVIYTYRKYVDGIRAQREELIIGHKLAVLTLANDFTLTFNLRFFGQNQSTEYPMIESTLPWMKYGILYQAVKENYYGDKNFIFFSPEMDPYLCNSCIVDDKIFSTDLDKVKFFVAEDGVISDRIIAGNFSNLVFYLSRFCEALISNLNLGIYHPPNQIINKINKEYNSMVQYYWGEISDIFLNYNIPRNITGIFKILQLLEDKNLYGGMFLIIKNLVPWKDYLWNQEEISELSQWEKLVNCKFKIKKEIK